MPGGQGKWRGRCVRGAAGRACAPGWGRTELGHAGSPGAALSLGLEGRGPGTSTVLLPQARQMIRASGRHSCRDWERFPTSPLPHHW